MKPLSHNVLLVLFLFNLFFLLNSQESYSQVTDILTSDSTTSVESVSMTEISLQSSKDILRTKRITDKLISEEELLNLKTETDSVVNNINDLLENESDESLLIWGNRKLENNIMYWNQRRSILQDQLELITIVLNDLKDSNTSLTLEVEKWENTERIIKEEEYVKAVHARVDEVLDSLNFALNTINKKNRTALTILDKVATLDLDVDIRITEIEKAIMNKQQRMFKSNLSSFFTIDYSNENNWNLTGPMMMFIDVDLINLKEFIFLNISYVLFQLLLIISLIFLFYYIKRLHVRYANDESSFYIKRLKTILIKPISAALIIGLFAKQLIYPNSIPIFDDIIRLLVMIPFVVMLTGIIHRRYHSYIYALLAVILLHLVYMNLPDSNIVSRFILVFIALIEIAVFSHFILYYKKRNYKKNDLIVRVILIFSYVNFIMAIAGLFGNIFGKVLLAEFFLFSVAGIALSSALIILSVIVINGLFVFLLDSKIAEKSNVIKRNKLILTHKVTRIFNILAVLLLIYYVLKIIGLETSFMDSISDMLSKERSLGSVVFSWSKLLIFFVVIWFSIFISNIIRIVLEDDILNNLKLDKGLPHTISMMVKYSLVTIGVFVAVSAAGLPLSEFTIIFGAFGVGIGFGLQNIFNNLVSGLILLFERPIKIGDTIEVGTLMGNVKSIGIRSSNVRTFDGAEIIVPNGNLISNEVVNWTLSDQRRRIEVIVGVSYSSNPHQVHDILLEILNKHKDIVNDPEPNVFFKDLGESSLDFRLLFWTTNFDQWIRIRSEIIFNVFDELKAADIEIPFPQRDLNVRSLEKDIMAKL